MCGIAGFLRGTGPQAASPASEADLRRMLARIAHRGPDDEGRWLGDGLALGHRRLSIVDLSPLGHQPMRSASARYVIAFNGEIYNHARLRRELEAAGDRFRGHSDTEVLLALIDRHGLAGALRRCIGMFAVALWDRLTHTLELARDRFGEKPLHYGWQDDVFLFASELKALATHPAFAGRLAPGAAAELLSRGYIDAPRTVYEGICKVEPGQIVRLRRAGANGRTDVEAERYWSPVEAMANGQRRPFAGRYEEAVDELGRLLDDAVSLQMQADVPLGAFLSGGIDSSLVVALMQRRASTPVRTFAIGFEEPSLDEAPHARAVARHLGTSHTELQVSSTDALALVPELSTLYDEPFADSSQLPTVLVARLARAHVTVALSGDGGDELFGGYTKYRLQQRLSHWPMRRTCAAVVSRLPWRAMAAAERRFRGSAPRLTPQRAATLCHLLEATSEVALAQRLSLLNCDARYLLSDAQAPFQAVVPDGMPTDLGPLRTPMLLDQLAYLPEDVLVKVDRATMSTSLESRAPLLDHRVAEFAAALPTSFLARDAVGKLVLRSVLERHVPRALFDRPKQGFSVPMARWLRHELKDWAHDVLAPSPSRGSPLDLRACTALLEEHRRGDRDASAALWPALVLQTWIDHTGASA